MSSTIRIRRSRRTVAAAAALGILALGGSLALPAQAALADGGGEGTLSVQAPASVGFAGQPVAFTETVTNTGTETTTYSLGLDTTTEVGTPPNAITIDYKDPANGRWTSVPLEFHAGAESATYQGMVHGITVAPGKSVKVDLRIGAPMGLPHQGATNGGFPSINLRAGLTVPGSWVKLDEHFETIKVESIGSSLAHVPATAVAGGDPIEFDAVLANPTPSGYVNLGNVLFTDTHATVQVRTADGTWTTLKQVSGGAEDPQPGVYLQGRNSAIGAGKTKVTRVRVSYDGTTPPGATKINPCVFVNEGDAPFRGTTMCSQGATVTVVAPAETAPAKPAAPAKPVTPVEPAAAKPAAPAGPAAAKPAVAKPAADVQPVAEAAPVTEPKPVAAAPVAVTPVAGELAATGTESDVVPAAAAAALATLGAGVVLFARRLRRRS
ncbi:hypothetical protein [Kitasatospora sp. NPDC047058]|uniref:hypothetical protein n=1 Tax=Kitasatospora sp. NPDC047058 TaxID=3155620 RepID=UPI0033FD078D